MREEKFFGRKAQIELLLKRVSGLKHGYRQNIAILGDELVGKTCVINKFLDKFSDSNFVVAYLEPRPETQNLFIRRFAGTILYSFLINSGLPLKEDLDYLLKKSNRFAPETCFKIRELLNVSARKNSKVKFEDLLLLCDCLHKETGKYCVVVFDEFLNLEALKFRSLYRDWSKFLLTNKNTIFIITSSLKFKARQVLAKDLSLLFGNFETLNIEPFDVKESEEFIGLHLSGYNLSPGLKDFLVNFTGGYPFYLRVICEAILAHPEAELSETIESLLFDSGGILNQRFYNYLKRFLDLPEASTYISILNLIASGTNRIKDIAHVLKIKKDEVDSRLLRLLELDALAKSGDFLRVNDRVFGFWLKFVYQKKSSSLSFDSNARNLLLREKVEESINEFLASAQKPLIERMNELLHLFEDEVLQVEKKKIRLVHFREIKPLIFGKGGLRHGLLGRAEEGLWILGFKQDALTEEDICEFVRECRKYRSKLQRKIIVTTKDIDSNARLRALEEKIWTWDLNSLNQMLDLYSQPRVIA